jgi:hypothetical protein
MRVMKSAWMGALALALLMGCGGGGGGGSAVTGGGGGGGGGTVNPSPTRVVVDGATNPDTSGVSGIRVLVYNATNVLVTTITTDSVGNTVMPSVPAGNYFVTIDRATVNPAAFYASFIIDGNAYLLSDRSCPAPVQMAAAGEFRAGNIRLTPVAAPPPPPPSCQ